MIKAVIFDVDGVLIHSLEANHKFFTDLMKKFGYGFMKLEEYIHHFHLPMKEIIRYSTKLTNEEEIEKIWNSGKNREVPYPFKLLVIPENLTEVIETLSKKYILGIVTSRSVSTFSISELNNLKKYFQIEILYGDTKNHKPHPEPLILAVEKLKFKSEECVYVGDSESDLIAARAAGMKCIIIRSHKRDIKNADVNISFFAELPKIIKSI